MRLPRRRVSGLARAFLFVMIGLVPAGASRPRAEEPPAGLATQAGMTAAFDDYFRVALDLAKPLAVHDLTLKRDNMVLTLADGVIYLARPVAGKVPGAYFSGTGTIKVAIPNPIDRKLLRDDYPKPAFEEAIAEAVLRFDDGAEKEILAAAKPGAGAAAPPSTWGDRLKIDFNVTSLQMDHLENALNGFAWATFFNADVRVRDGKDWYGFASSGRNRIEDAIFHERMMGSAGKRWYETISMFHRPGDYDAKGNYDLLPAADDKDPAALRGVEMTIDIPNTKTVGIDAKLTVEALRDGLRAVRFNLINNLGDAWYEGGRTVKVDRVADDAGNLLPYIHACNDLLVLLPRALSKGERVLLQVKATEDTIIQLTDKSYWIFTDSAWFPQIGGAMAARFTFDWTFRIVKPMRVASSGDLVREWAEGDRNCGRYRSEVPSAIPAFIFGDLKANNGKYTREPPGTGEVALCFYTVLGGAFHFKGNPANILFNISQGLKAFEAAFGPYPYKDLDIAEIAPQVPFAQSPAGILLFPAMFTGTSGGGGEADQVVYHELAHQWWGHNVGPAGREDDWISESWAEYSSALVTQAIDRKKFRTMRDEWREKAFETDRYGTIATAYRSNSIEYGMARTNLLYNKGPCVIHMLRTWMGWEKFSKYVFTIQSKYGGTLINTDTLAREAGTAMGYDMFPFFDQWVRDRGIPKVHYTWRVAPEADGKQLLTITVRQEDEANSKILMVPISLDFGKGDPTVVQKPVLKARAEIQLRLPAVPKKVVLDPDEDLLATFIADTPASR
ncbi:MAG TPA: M1 family aminopeptidase [Candidatus Polarisedimenticolia bacterium]|nr:M1 family aminopeptidase [Candidatus Polarisedimenticolia bacterium]